MHDVVQHIENIEEKIQRLGKKLSDLEAEKALLVEENLKLKKDLEQLRNSEKALNLQIENLQKDRGNAGTAMLKQNELKKELDVYIKEVDKCIQLMEDIA